MPKEIYSASEAAKALGISIDTLRRWDRAGRIRTERDGANRRIVRAPEIERLRGDSGTAHLSARNRFKGVVTMYENMKAKDAARIFDRLDLNILIEVSTAINPRKMSDILAQMTPESAERLTVELANRSSVVKAQAPGQLPKIQGTPNGL